MERNVVVTFFASESVVCRKNSSICAKSIRNAESQAPCSPTQSESAWLQDPTPAPSACTLRVLTLYEGSLLKIIVILKSVTEADSNTNPITLPVLNQNMGGEDWGQRVKTKEGQV